MTHPKFEASGDRVAVGIELVFSQAQPQPLPSTTMGVSTVTAAVIGGTAAAAGYAAGYFVRASAEEPNVEEVATIPH